MREGPSVARVWMARFPYNNTLEGSLPLKHSSCSFSRLEAAEAVFLCEHCRQPVPGRAPGTEHRNHCPHCLWSLHADLKPGDRRSKCRGGMEPVGVTVRRGGEWALIHRCTACGKVALNRIAGDDSPLALMSLAVRPLAQPPFPLESLNESMTDEPKGEKHAPKANRQDDDRPT